MKKKSLIKDSCSDQGLTIKWLNIRNLELSFRGNEALNHNWEYNYCLDHFEWSKTSEYEESLTKSHGFVERQSGRRCRMASQSPTRAERQLGWSWLARVWPETDQARLEPELTTLFCFTGASHVADGRINFEREIINRTFKRSLPPNGIRPRRLQRTAYDLHAVAKTQVCYAQWWRGKAWLPLQWRALIPNSRSGNKKKPWRSKPTTKTNKKVVISK